MATVYVRPEDTVVVIDGFCQNGDCLEKAVVPVEQEGKPNIIACEPCAKALIDPYPIIGYCTNCQCNFGMGD